MVVRVVACVSLLADTHGRDLDHGHDDEEEEEEEDEDEDEESAEEEEAGSVVHLNFGVDGGKELVVTLSVCKRELLT